MPNRVLAKALKEARKFIGVTHQMRRMQHRTVEVPVPWIYPKQDHAKLNSDGASNQQALVGIGGVLRGDQGGFLACYAKHIFKNDNNVAEVWAIRNGLLLAKEMGIKKLEVESDSTYAIQLCNKEVLVPWSLHALVEGISILKGSFESISFNRDIERRIRWLTG